VTQGGESYLIKALQDAGDQRWFMVLERVGLDNLIKERQMIRQMRELYQGKDAKSLPPMMFAGIIMEGAIVGYDSNSITGGSGVRVFGIGASTQYQSDTVTVTLRTVSVSSGEVLTSVTVTKTVLSYMDKMGVLKFYDSGTQALEAETGASINESINRAVNASVQAAVVATIKEGVRKGHWSYRQTPITQTVPVVPDNVPVVSDNVPVVPVTEVKKEEQIPTVANISARQYLNVDSYVYKEPNETSQRTWLLKKGTELVVSLENGEWVAVEDAHKRKGFVKKNVLGNKIER
jgi:curli biogenesis system outer membrane secretion channel CsgG